MNTSQQTKPDKYTLGPDCDSGCLDQGIRVCGHEFSMKHHLDDCKQTATPAQASVKDKAESAKKLTDWLAEQPEIKQASHSPLPWNHRIETSHTRCAVTDYRHLEICEVYGIDRETRNANAAFIVRACNEYEQLLSECQRVTAECSQAIVQRDQAKAHAQRLADNTARLANWMQRNASTEDTEAMLYVIEAQKALALYKESPADADALEALDQLEQLEGGE